MNLLYKVWPLTICSIVFHSCQKVVDINLNDSSPQIIIEGVITNTPGTYQVQISRTVNFSAANNYPAISGALVVIADKTSSITDTLSENSAGIYITHSIQGISGHTYDLFVSSAGQTYSASSTMPFPVPLDSIAMTRRSNFAANGFRTHCYFQDPASIANYYTFNQLINRKKLNGTNVFGDRLSDGLYISQRLFSDTADIKIADTVLVEMNCVDRTVWNYFNTLQNGGVIGLTAPANPTSNISNNALGYFSAHSVQSKTAVAQ